MPITVERTSPANISKPSIIQNGIENTKCPRGPDSIMAEVKPNNPATSRLEIIPHSAPFMAPEIFLFG